MEQNSSAWVHNIDPFAIKFWDNLTLQWQQVFWIAIVVLGIYVLVKTIASYKKNKKIKFKFESTEFILLAITIYITYKTWFADVTATTITLPANFGIRWYGLAYLAGFFVAYFVIKYFLERAVKGMDQQVTIDFITYSAIGIMVGARLGYCLFYNPSLLIDFSSKLPFWGALAINEGGMSSHGGMIGIVVTCILFARRYKVNLRHTFDLVVIGSPLGIFFGRIANFINGELVGRPAGENVKWAVKFPQDIFSWSIDKLKDLQSVVIEFGVKAEQWLDWLARYNYDREARSAVQEHLVKIVDAIQNGHETVRQTLAPHLVARHPSQLYAALLEGVFVFLVLALYSRKPRKPGLIGALFLIVYGVVRILDEFFRMPDSHIGYQLLGLTRGQWLCVVMLIGGVAIFSFWHKKEGELFGGWQRQAKKG